MIYILGAISMRLRLRRFIGLFENFIVYQFHIKKRRGAKESREVAPMEQRAERKPGRTVHSVKYERRRPVLIVPCLRVIAD